MSRGDIVRTLKSVVDLKTMTTISWQELLDADFERYNEIRRTATEAWLAKKPRYVCSQCGYYVYAPNHRTKRPYWKHYSGAPQNCPWWTGEPDDPDRVSARQFGGRQEGPLHFKIKHLLADILENDPRAKDVSIEEYIIEDTKIDGAVSQRRKPDVSAVYDGVKTAFEVQLATTQLPLIISKEGFYARNGVRLVWLTWEFQERPLKEIQQAFADIYCTPEENIFSLDSEVIQRSQYEQTLYLRAHAYRDDAWQNKSIPLHDVFWNERGMPFVYAKKATWPDGFRQRWIEAKNRERQDWEAEKTLLFELSSCLGVSYDPVEWQEGRFSELLDCLYSLRDGKPVVSRQKNLFELANTFLGSTRCKKYAQIFEFAARYYGHSNILERDSVRQKLEEALKTGQVAKQTPETKAIRVLFPEWLENVNSGARINQNDK